MPVRVSMRKIAEVAGVSVAAVSQVLNNRDNICSAETAKRIREVASELGYRVNFGYKIMHSIPTRTVAVLAATEFGSNKEYIRELTLRLLTEFGDRGYAAYFYTLPLSESDVYAKIDEFLARGVEHFVFIGMPVGVERVVDEITRAGAGILFSSYNKKYRYVASDSAAAMTELLNFIRSRCGENFRFFCTDSTIQMRDERAIALKRVFPELQFSEIIRKYTVQVATDGYTNENYFDIIFNEAREAAAKQLALEPHLQGLAFTNDIAAMGAASMLLELDRRDVIVTGFNGDHAAQNFPYPITTSRPDIRELAVRMVENTMSAEDCRELIMPRIIIRTPQES